MDRKGSFSKRPTKGHPPPGDFIALGKSQARSGSESDLRHSGAPSAQPLGRKAPLLLGDRKREAPGTSGLGLAPKRPKLLGQGQTFTPLGRSSEVERRGSPSLQTLQFEESAIDVEPLTFLDQILESERDSDDERVERLLCGSVKHLRMCRFKPDQAVHLTLMYLSKTRPLLFGSELIIEAFCSLLKRDATINFKAKGNPLVSVLACNVMLAAYMEEENWPEEFVKVYIEDSLGERVWVDREDTKGFVDNIQTAFSTKLPPRSSLMLQSDNGKTGEQSGSSSPAAFLFEDDEKSNDSEKMQLSSASESSQNVTIFPRYPYQQDVIETYVTDVIRDHFNRRQPLDPASRNLIRLMTATCGYAEVRLLASQRLEMWLQNPKQAKAAQDLLMSVCLNCAQHDKSDVEVIKQLLKIRLKTKALINHFLLSIRELMSQHPDNMKLILTHTIYNELSTARNPNNMPLLVAIFQQDAEKAAKVLAEIFQDLLVNKDDYLRALRALLREIVRSLRHDLTFSHFCLGMMQERTEAKFVDMEPPFKERYVNSIVDLITLSILLGVTPAVREAATAQARGERRDLDALFHHRSQAAIIERDSVWWLHTVVPKLIELKPQDYMHCLRKVLFMESPEHYYNKDNWPPEGDRGVLLKLASEAPVLEDTLMRILVIGLSRDLPVNAPDAMDLAHTLVKRAAMLHMDGHEVLRVERLEFIDALLNLCAYRHPENTVLPKGYQPPSLAISALYWRAWSMLLIITAYNPTTFGRIADNYPTLKCLIEMVITNNYDFPPPTTASDDKIIEDMKNRELQVEQLEKQQILEFETHLAAASKMTITEHNSLLIAQLTTMNPSGITRRPPQAVLEQLKTLTNLLNIREMFCKSRDPDFLSDIIKRQGTSRSMPWLADLVESSEGSLDVLPVQCLCEFLLHESPQDLAKELEEEDENKPETKLKRMKLRKQEQLLSRLQKLVHDGSSDSQTTFQVLDYFLQKLASHQSSARQQAIKGLSMVISSPSSTSSEHDDMEVEEESEVARYMPQHKWLLTELPSLPVFSDVRGQLSVALRQACQVETDPSLVSAYIVFLSHYAMNQQLQTLSELAVDLGQLIVERCAVINHLFPMEEERRTRQADITLRSLIHLYTSYLRKAKEPDRASYTWSDTQDQILLQWENGETATMHVLVVHAMVILLSYGPPKDDCMYEELLETWFPTNSHPPSAFLLDTSEEALLLPDWLKLKMIRSKVQRVVDAALQDLEPAQLLLFVQSFGIPVSSMSKLLECLDNAVGVDSGNLEQAVIDKGYMAQLIEIQQMRGASGGDRFYHLLTQGAPKPPPVAMEEEKKCVEKPVLVTDTRHTKEQLLKTVPEAVECLKMIFLSGGPSVSARPPLHSQLMKKLTLAGDFPDVLIEAFNTVLSDREGKVFLASLHRLIHLSCPLVRLLSAKQPEGTSQQLAHLFEKIASMSGGQRSGFSAVVNQYLTSCKRQVQKEGSKKVETKRDTKEKTEKEDESSIIRELQRLDGEGNPSLGKVIERRMKSAVERGRAAGTQLACKLMLHSETGLKLPTSAANLLTDWLELLDPEVIQSTPELQRMLIFGRQPGGQDQERDRGSNQPYLLALLTHQSSWSTLRQCMDLLLRVEDINRYDPTCVLDFLWACYNIPKIWQGRDRKLPKNYTPEDVLGLTDSQLICLADTIVAEGNMNQSASSAGSHVKVHVPVEVSDVMNSRTELIKCCLCGRENKLKVVVNHVQWKLKEDSDLSQLYGQLLVELYLQYPYIGSWLEENCPYIMDTQSTQRGHSQLDMISHRLITTLGQAVAGKQAENRMRDANIACRKLSAQHPLLILRQLPMLAALLKGRTQFTFGEMRHRNYLLFFTHVLGLLELLQPHIFRKEFTALEDLLGLFFDLIQAHGMQKQMVSVIVKFMTFLHQFISQEPQRAGKYLQQHVQLLSQVSNQYPELAILKSLLAGLTLPRQNTSEGEFSSGETTPSVTPARPASPWTTAQLEPFHKKLKRDNMDDVFEVLHDLDEASKRKVYILQYYIEDLKRLLVVQNDRCRNTAFALLLRHIRHSPGSAPSVLPAFLHCLDSQSPDLINSALRNLPEFAVLCQGHACSLLQRAFTVGITTTVETHTYIAEALQLLNMESP
ncbi:integrator complex subunit 1-like [Liolophura sinensis]|uniref:integrator complex subunit 1-like n=1 Tax=Liolophura sinensis TaxID=3198878 RepID=UPI00315822AD